jgi:hypothetical protein
LAEVRPWYKDETLKEMANKYWKKRSYLFQGFVRQNPLGDDKTPANPIRRFIISPQIIPIVKAGLMDPEIEELPTDFLRGLDFNIKKTSKGGYADYSTSNWARKESPLTEAEQAAIEAHGLFNLADFLPKKPGAVELKVIAEMFAASVDGEAYDPARWSQYFKPAGFGGRDEASGSSTPAPTSAPKAAPAPVAEEVAPWEEEVATAEKSFSAPAPKAVSAGGEASSRAADIIAMIRNRQST